MQVNTDIYVGLVAYTGIDLDSEESLGGLHQ